MKSKLNLAVMLLAAAGLAFLAAGCQDPYLAGANIILNKPPDEVNQDDYKAVIRNLQSAIEQGYPQNYGKYYSTLAYCYYHTMQYPLARTSMDSAVKYWPDKADSLNEVRKGYWGLQFNMALENLRRAAEVPKTESGPLVEKAQNHINNAVAIIPDRVEDHIIQAQLYKFVGKNAEAKQLFEKAAATDPSNAAVHDQLGRIAYESQDWDATILHLEKATSLKQDNYTGFFLLGVSYLRKKEFAKAQAPLAKAAGLNPGEKDAWINLGLAFFNEGRDMKAAAQALEKALEIDPDDIDALEMAGLSYLSQSVLDFDGAIRIYKRATGLRPDKVEFWKNLLYAYKQKKMTAEAKEVERRIKQLQK